MNRCTKRTLILFHIILIGLCIDLQGQTLKEIEAHTVSLPNGWKLTPVGKLLPLGDLPLNIAVSPSKKLAAVTNNGESDQTIQLVDIEKQEILDSIIIGKAWLGLAFSDDGNYLYASGGNDNIIIRYAIRNNRLMINDSLRIGEPWPEKISVAGLAIDDSRNRLYAVTKENNSLYVLDTHSKKVVSQFPLEGEAYTCLLSPDRKLLFISCWGCDKVIIFDTEKQKIVGSVSVGDNPNDLCITSNGKYPVCCKRK